ncbi:hypothetical protein XELAEV_18041435mg [Xenopus laevis]|uniref:Transcription factor CBF/NF-Y/archaeal histone domain-containing protein n=1 Tax=Xenopus laevis TaxID=8355 RepID=A0A974C2U6_XENLA|nr:hypothetical protein XELAEV_18041435mg [Xenopus laevis]
MAERPEDLNLPNTVVTRIIEDANNFAMKGKRMTLNASDVLAAMKEMEFQRFLTPESLEVYRQEQKGKKEAKGQKKKDKEKKVDSEDQDKSREEKNEDEDGGRWRKMKKQKKRSGELTTGEHDRTVWPPSGGLYSEA